MWARWYGPLVERFRTWASEEPSIRAALIVGSQARSEEPADEWSDLDVVIFHDHPERLIDSVDWVARFGEVVLTMVEPTAVLRSRERRVLYRDGKDVDFAVFPSESLSFISQSPEGVTVLGRGYKILLDKDARFSQPEALPGPEGHPLSKTPNEAEFQATVADFWYHVQWAAKKLRRGELWAAKMGCDGYLKLLLVRVIGWNTVLRHGAGTDVWHDGRFLDRWVGPEIRGRLTDTFARYDRPGVARAILATSQLFSELARDVATGCEWSYPGEAESFVLDLASGLLQDIRRAT